MLAGHPETAEQAEIKEGYARLSGQVLAIAVTGFLLFTQVFLATQASGNDMFPAVKDGDLLIGFRLQKELSKNDIVIYETEGRQRVARIGKENDAITLDDTGSLLVNGTVQGNEILSDLCKGGDGVSLYGS